MLCLRGNSDSIYIALFSVILLIKVVALLIVRVSCRREMIHTIAFFFTLNVRQDRAAMLISQLEIKCGQTERLLCVALTRKCGAHLVVVTSQLPLWIPCLLNLKGLLSWLYIVAALNTDVLEIQMSITLLLDYLTWIQG